MDAHPVELLIVGGGLGGVSAALTAARLGIRIVLVEELDWLGGQLTAQGVPLDEHPWVETGIGSRSYAMFRHSIREYYPQTLSVDRRCARTLAAQSRHGQRRDVVS
jgi:NADPH-dependent 2,4-dienoyl-CoA reductase/sulfur reductase-like enzyme